MQLATSNAADDREDAGADLLNTKPTTLAGILALCRYVEPLFDQMDAPELPATLYWDDGTQWLAAGAFANVIAAAVKVMLGCDRISEPSADYAPIAPEAQKAG